MFPIVVGVPVLPVVPVVVAPRFQGWVGFAPAWGVYMDWMEDYEYMIWHRWQRMIACRHLSVMERRRMLVGLIQRENRYESSKKIDRLADRMLGMEEDLGADEWGHVVSEETTTTTTTSTAQQQRQQRREQEEEQMNVRRVNAANGLVDAARESGNQDIASLRRTQEMILAGKMDDLVLAQEEEQQSGQVRRRKKASMPATPGPSTPVPAMTAPPTPGPSTPRRLQGRLNAGGHSYSSQSLQQSFESPMPQPQYQPQAPLPAPTPPRPASQATMYNYNEQQFQQSVQNPPPAPPPTNQNYQQGLQQYNQSIQQQQQRQQQQQQPIPTEKPKRPKDRGDRSSKRHHHYTQTTTTTTVTTSNTTSDDVEEDAQQPQYPGPQYGQQPYGQQPYGHHQQFATPPPAQKTPNQPPQITQSGNVPSATFSGQTTNQPGPTAHAGFHPDGGYPIPNPSGWVPSSEVGLAKKKKEKKEKWKGKGQGEKETKKKKKKYDEL